MGLLTRLLATDAPSTSSAALEVHAHAEQLLSEATWPSTFADASTATPLAIDRKRAMQVPAVARGRNILCGTIAELPLQPWAADGKRLEARPWMRQPERHVARAVTVAWTVDDLLFHGIAYWQVTELYAEDGRPSRYERIAPTRVGWDTDSGGRVTRWRVDGVPVPHRGVGRLVVINALEDGVLRRGTRTLRTALELERATLRYAEEPVPASILKNTGPELSPDKITALLAAWKTARRSNATAYLNASLELQALGLDPSTMQLTEARAYVVTEVARLLNVDAYYLNADQGSGSAMTYSNITTERRKLVDFSLRHYLAALEGRLSMDDVTPIGTEVRFGLDAFLRGEASDRASIYAQLIPLGVLTVEEARAMEDLAPTGATPDDDQEPAGA